MTAAELREKIRALALQVVGEKSKADQAAVAYDELTKFPELKDIIVSLMTHEFDSFLEGIDWVAPRPSTFRINLLNGQNFILMFTPRSWIAQVEGKKYYLLNLDEEEYAALAISRILQYGPESGAEVEGAESETDSAPEVEDEVDVDVDVEA
jgi:hypothetical protein|tara:strand:+ start:1881 stop:2336 length:456 start_codon:yes stop_codon:yes gene_type:complete